MALASVIAEHEEPLRADLQQHYGIDLDAAIGGGHTARHIASLVAQLPHDSRLVCRLDEDARWTLGDVLTAALLNNFNLFVWAMSDPRKRGAKPELVGPSWMTERGRKTLPARVLPINQLLEELNRPRRRTDGG